jgi:hypothetical protein
MLEGLPRAYLPVCLWDEDVVAIEIETEVR